MPGQKGQIMGTLATLLTLLTAGLLLVGSLVWWLQPKLVFRPFPEMIATPADWGMAFEEVWLEAADGVSLHAWFIPAAERRATGPGTLLFLHGNAGNISHRSTSLAIFRDLGLDVLIPDYRGYGRSDGRPDEQGLYRDASAAWDWLTAERDLAARDIVIFGRSLGGAVATELAARVQPAGLIVESSFTDLDAMARLHHPLLAAFVPLRYRFPSVGHITRVGCPVLVLHSPDDGIVPFEHGRGLFAAAPEPKVFVELQGGHNEGFLDSQPGYEQALDAFLAGLGQAP
jgi:fermentation-respiration switch protein FrsA (DUF1100 family)